MDDELAVGLTSNLQDWHNRGAPRAAPRILMPDVAPSTGRISPLFALFPFLRPYARRWALAFVALVTSAGATLALPVTFRYLIDRGFASGNRAHIDRYFLALFT